MTGVIILYAPLLVGEEIRCAVEPVQIQCRKMEASLVMVQHPSLKNATPSPVRVRSVTMHVLMTENLTDVSNVGFCVQTNVTMSLKYKRTLSQLRN